MAPSFGITPRGFVPPPRRHDLRVGFTTSVFTARDVVSDGSDGGVYHIGVPSKNVPVARAASEEHLDVEVSLHAWKDQKYLNSWIIGDIQRWGTLSEEVRAGR
ncbi:uncharacterized protein G6M90_00g091340 [Metarhizium brunneum]|uniref:Uncharacterized protein n=1 Tax=Metarhizium brunneum TaxID=500148 RepID=A0A7D5YXA5_9HYPO|nr:hypothetical protein G6M90_00g091340 [Metarhizium brunneum]